jgi:NADPH-dependent curcumin reductase CurA
MPHALSDPLLTNVGRYKEQRYEGLSQVGQAILDVQSGKNKGKAVIIVADH